MDGMIANEKSYSYKNYTSPKAAILGMCNNCKVGEVKYYRSETVGIRFCDNCNISTYNGNVVFTTKEAAHWK